MSSHIYNTSNPAFSRDVWSGYSSSSQKMTLNGIIIKSIFCIALITITTWYVWFLYNQGVNIKWITYGGFIGAIVFSLLTAFVHKLGSILVPLYAIAMGLFLGGILVFANNKLNGIPIHAIGITLATFLIMLLVYKTHIIKVSERFQSVLILAISIIITIYLISYLLTLANIEISFIWGTSWYSILFNVLAVSIASFSLLLDFDFIERKKNHVPRYMEWVAAWGLLFNLFWLYIEGLRIIKRFITGF